MFFLTEDLGVGEDLRKRVLEEIKNLKDHQRNQQSDKQAWNSTVSVYINILYTFIYLLVYLFMIYTYRMYSHISRTKNIKYEG